jgi:hypothetical protein
MFLALIVLGMAIEISGFNGFVQSVNCLFTILKRRRMLPGICKLNGQVNDSPVIHKQGWAAWKISKKKN